MNEAYYQLVKRHYQSSRGEFTQLFQTILSVANEIGLDDALRYLERCVIEKRLSWLDRNLEAQERTGNPLGDGYRIFYEVYLGISAPEDGEIVEATGGRLVTRWWNHCPTLEVCQRLGLNTREVCRRAYHSPVQVFLSRIEPRLRFDRNYDALRPRAPYCEEIMTLEGLEPNSNQRGSDS